MNQRINKHNHPNSTPKNTPFFKPLCGKTDEFLENR
jgi:hypothetical protein